MDVTQTSAALAPPAQGQGVPESAPKLSSDFETFLKMLTVQMENQDPLNPVDSADYAVQLATFSSVEQQVLTNDLLSKLSTSMTGGGLNGLSQWVGMEVRGGTHGYFAGSAIDLSAPTSQEADRRVLAVRDEQGSIVARVDVPLNDTVLSWDGKLASGAEVSKGIYTFSIEHFKTGTLISSEPVETYNTVKEARMEDGSSRLVMIGGMTLSPDDVTAFRAPDISTESE